MATPIIHSDGDLEVVVLHETHSTLAKIIGPDLYKVGGIAPEQSILFHNRPAFNLFLIYLIELIAEGQQSAFIDDRYQNLSLISGLRKICDNHTEECNRHGLIDTLTKLEEWVEKEVKFKFSCPDVNQEIEFTLKNHALISFGANTTKHNLLRLSKLISKLERFCGDSGYEFSPQELSAVLSAMIEEVNSRLQYHSSHLVEMLGKIFLSLNSLIIERFDANPTNKVNEMTMPEGITSDIFKDMYGTVMVFKRYEEKRIKKYTPISTRFLKIRY
ncbi:MAG: hypothetical protein AB2817_07050 [Candidatus Thiodiazotropha sp.]